MNLTMCGYCCDLCKAYRANIEQNDERGQLSAAWKKYYDIDIVPQEIYCDGCRCMQVDAKRIDNACPVRACAIKRGVEHCGFCGEYPCKVFELRAGLSGSEAKDKLGNSFSQQEYDCYLLAYDNKTRISKMRSSAD